MSVTFCRLGSLGGCSLLYPAMSLGRAVQISPFRAANSPLGDKSAWTQLLKLNCWHGRGVTHTPQHLPTSLEPLWTLPSPSPFSFASQQAAASRVVPACAARRDVSVSPHCSSWLPRWPSWAWRWRWGSHHAHQVGPVRVVVGPMGEVESGAEGNGDGEKARGWEGWLWTDPHLWKLRVAQFKLLAPTRRTLEMGSEPWLFPDYKYISEFHPFWFWNLLCLFPIPSVSMRLSENSISCFPFSEPPLRSLQ